MKKLVSWVVGAVITFCACAYLLNHLPLLRQAQPAEQSQPPAPRSAEAEEANQMVTMTGPLVDYMQREKPPNGDSQPALSAKPNASDLIAPSPVGTGGVILHKTFALASTVKFAFEVPAHATSPQLHGTYRSFIRQAGALPADDNANVEFLLMNEQQYADFLRGRPADVLFFAKSSHSEQVNFDLAPTFDQPAQYCLVFRNRSGGAARKIVQANFSVDF